MSSDQPSSNQPGSGQPGDADHAPPAELTGDPCFDAINLLHYYLDQELTETLRVTITAHIETCPGCLPTYEFHAELRAVIRKRTITRVPEELRQRIARELGN